MTQSTEAPAEPTWFPSADSSPEEARRWLKDHEAWAFSSDPSDGEDEEFDGDEEEG